MTTYTNQTKNISTFVGVPVTPLTITWNQETQTWDVVQGTWDNQRPIFTNGTKSTTVFTGINKT